MLGCSTSATSWLPISRILSTLRLRATRTSQRNSTAYMPAISTSGKVWFMQLRLVCCSATFLTLTLQPLLAMLSSPQPTRLSRFGKPTRCTAHSSAASLATISTVARKRRTARGASEIHTLAIGKNRAKIT